MSYVKTVGTGLIILSLIAVVISTNPDVLPDVMQISFGGLQGFFLGANWSSLLKAGGGGAMAFVCLTIGIWTAAMLSMLLGRFVIRPFVRRLPKFTPPTPPPVIDRILRFIQPPDPPKTIKGRPFMEVAGIPLTAFMHLMPPPGPWAMRMVIDVLFGLSTITIWRFAVGSFIGIVLHLGALVAITHFDLSLPAPPGGIKGLVLTIFTPIILTILVRSAIFINRRFRSSGPV